MLCTFGVTPVLDYILKIFYTKSIMSLRDDQESMMNDVLAILELA